MIPDDRLRKLLQDAEQDVRSDHADLGAAYLVVEGHRAVRRRPRRWLRRAARMGTVIAFAALILAAFVGSLLIAGGVNLRPSTTATPEQPVDLPKLTDAQWEWCQLHTGGPGADQHQVEDAALTFGGPRYGWVTRADVFGRWQESPDDLRLDITYREACLAALAALGPVSSATPASSLDRSPSAGA